MAKKAKKKPISTTYKNKKSVFAFIKDHRFPKLVGLTFVLIALFLLIAFTSYLFSWSSDQYLFQTAGKHWTQLLNHEITAKNTLGRLGAIISHQFFYLWFGLSSYLFAILLFVTGINLLYTQPVFPLIRIYKNSFFLLIWLSLALTFVFNFFDQREIYFPYGGAFGKHTLLWLEGFLGTAGAGFFLFFSFIGYLILSFNIDFRIPWIRQKSSLSEELNQVPVPSQEKDLPDDIFERENLEYGKEELTSLTGENDEPFFDVEIPHEEPPVTGSSHEGKKVDTPAVNKEGDLSLDIEELVEEKVVDDAEFKNYDPTEDLSNYKFPSLDLLEDYGDNKISIDTAELEKNKDQIISTLNNYNIQISKIKATVGPTVTLYEIVPAPGVRISRIKNLEDDIALSLAALGIRIIAPIPGKGTIGIEVPNVKKEIVAMRTLMASEKFLNAQMDLPIALGKNISNENYITDLAKMPHLLMAGATGQGKSVGLNAILMSLLYKKHPSQLKFILIDPKKVELSLFTAIEKHFLAVLPGEEEAIITDTKKVVNTLNALCIEMDNRYNLLKEAQVRNIKEYNEKFQARRLNPQKGHCYLPFIVLVVDEFADLMMTAGKEIEQPIARLAQLARAIGIHLVIATQRPSVNIITGTIKANFPARIAFKVTSKVDSRTILDTGGADQLIGRGDMLLSIGGNTVRLQCAFVDTHEVEKVTEFVGSQQGYPEPYFLPEVSDGEDGGSKEVFGEDDRDDMFEDAARLVIQHQQGSTSLIQRRLKLGYNRAGRIMDQLEAAGIVGPNEGSKAREVYYKTEYDLEQFLTNSE